MASEKPTKILRSKSDLSDEQITAMSDTQAWELIYFLDKERKMDARPKRPEICFTGFSLSHRAEMETIAASFGFEVKSSVTKTLDYLCTDPDSGPSKIAKAQGQGTTILSTEGFHYLCTNGVLPQSS